MKRFEDPSVMAVVPSLHIHEPSNLLQRMQKAEYFLGAFLRSILSELEAIYVTPGPLSMIRRSVFDQIGLYRKAHNTEDMEIAFRMQERGMKIVNAHDAIVHTSSPRSVRALYRQRVRWTSGFLFNLRDYRHMLGTMRYGNLGSFILPVMLVSTAAVLFIVSSFAYEAGTTIQQWYIRWQALGFARMFEWNSPNLDWFFMKTSPLLFGGLIATAIILSFILIGARISRGKRPGATDIACYAILYPFIVPWWVIRSLANLALSRQTAWR
jgi:cellulose synthase/poly-beta-1,6-N-acetylglucosamine synthase-like glycosyltransferase